MQNFEISKILTDLKNVFEETIVECTQVFFEQKSRLREEWKVVEQFIFDTDFVLTLSSGNPDYQAVLVVGIQTSALKYLQNNEAVNVNVAMDILGEFANNYSGMLADQSDFVNSFGVLRQEIPILYSQGLSLLNFISGVQGKVYFENHWIKTGYAIRERRKNV